MKLRNILLGAVAIGLASSALAGEKHFKINSDELGFDLHDMQEGESRSIIDESGQAILITRTSDGYSFDIGGETIELPDFQGKDDHGMAWIGKGEGGEIDVHVMHNAEATTMHEMNNTMIISAEPIDAATQQAIKDLLGSAGYDSDVSFIDRDAAHGRKVMIKKVERVVESPQT